MPSKTEAVRREYDRLAKEYDHRWRPYINATLDAVVSAARLSGNERLLDAPSGTGELERRLLERWPDIEIVGTDISRAMLEQAVGKSAACGPMWVQSDVRRLPFPAQSFDYAVCANSFHHFSSPDDSLRELRRVLQPNGTLLLVDWCDDYLVCKLCSLWLRWQDPAFHKAYSLANCESLLRQAGFDVERAIRFRVGLIWGMMSLVCRRR